MIDNPIVKDRPEKPSPTLTDFMAQYHKPILPSRLTALRESLERVSGIEKRR